MTKVSENIGYVSPENRAGKLVDQMIKGFVATFLSNSISIIVVTNYELREDGGYELREDGGFELRE